MIGHVLALMAETDAWQAVGAIGTLLAVVAAFVVPVWNDWRRIRRKRPVLSLRDAQYDGIDGITEPRALPIFIKNEEGKDRAMDVIVYVHIEDVTTMTLPNDDYALGDGVGLHVAPGHRRRLPLIRMEPPSSAVVLAKRKPQCGKWSVEEDMPVYTNTEYFVALTVTGANFDTVHFLGRLQTKLTERREKDEDGEEYGILGASFEWTERLSRRTVKVL